MDLSFPVRNSTSVLGQMQRGTKKGSRMDGSFVFSTLERLFCPPEKMVRISPAAGHWAIKLSKIDSDKQRACFSPFGSSDDSRGKG